jgi:hypothetical protein
VVQRIPSCKDGLTESIAQNKCVPTPAGTLPFFNTLNEMGDLAIRAGINAQAACLRDGNASVGRAKLNSIFTTSAIFSAIDKDKLGYVAIGFGCATPRILDSLAALRDVDPIFWRNFEVAFNEKFNSKPCADEANPVARVTCAIGRMMFEDMFSESICLIKSFKDFPDLFGSTGSQDTITAYNRLGEGIFILLQWSLEQYVSAKLAGPAKAKFKQKAMDRKRASNVKAGKSEDMMQYAHKIDRVLEIIKYMSLGRAVVNLKDRMQRIPECRGATGHGVTIEASVNEAWRNIPKGSAAVVKPETLFLVTDKGHLLRFVHDANGRFTVASQVVSTQNWNTMKFMGAASLPNGGTALYTILANGDLYYYALDGSGKFVNWGTKIGGGWGGFTNFMVARFGVIYTVDSKGDLRIYRHGSNLKFGPPKVIGNAWGGFKTLISGGTNALYAVGSDGKLLYYYHDDNYAWKAAAKAIGTGWAFKYLNSAGNGELYGVNEYGDLLFYRHDTSLRFLDGSGKTIGVGWGNPGKFGLIVAQH